MKRLQRILPHPLATLSILATWLIVNNTLDLAHVLLGGVLGLAIPALTRSLWPEEIALRRPGTFVRLVVVVLWDIVVANVLVARLIMGRTSRLRPAFVRFPLTLTNPYAISALASIITLTPGTVSADLAGDRRTLLIHALDVADPDALVGDIKRKYEAPLREIME